MPRINLTWSGCIIFLIWYWIRFANILFRIFSLIFMGDAVLYFSFLILPSLDLDIYIMLLHEMSQNIFLPFQWSEIITYRQTGIWRFGRIPLWNYLGLVGSFYVWGSVLKILSIPSMQINLLKLPESKKISFLVMWIFIRNHPLHLDFLMYLHRGLKSSLRFYLSFFPLVTACFV